VHNITTAVRRLSFAPSKKDMKVTDVKTGHFVFVPRADRPARFAELRREVVNAGYDIEGTTIEVHGALATDGTLRASGTGQPFALAGPRAGELRQAMAGASTASVAGKWVGDAKIDSIEVTGWKLVP
jgi:hypothetical protein